MVLIFGKLLHIYFEYILKDKEENALMESYNKFLFCGLCRFLYADER